VSPLWQGREAGSLVLAAVLMLLGARALLGGRATALLLGAALLVGWGRLAGRLPRTRVPARLAVSGAALAMVVLLFRLAMLSSPPPWSVTVLVGGLVGCAAVGEPVLARRLRGGVRAALAGAGALALTFGLLHESLDARFGLVDDHEILRFLGDDGRLSLAEVLPLWSASEAGAFGGSLRYRPVYYLLRIAETWLWQGSPAWWYASRLLQLAAALGLIWLALGRWVGPLTAAVLGLLMLTPRFWGDVWCRLGPSEAYAFLGLALFLWGGSAVLDRRASTAAGWLAVTVGAVAAMGAKENFLFLAPATLGLALWAQARRRLTRGGMVGTTLVLLAGALVLASLALALAPGGRDVYENPTAATGRLGPAAHALRSAARAAGGWPPWAALSLLALGAGSLGPRGQGRDVARACLALAGALGGLGLLAAFQGAFYAGVPVAGSRYELPRGLVPLAASLVAASFGLSVLRRLRVDPSVVRGLRAGLVGGAALLVAHRGFTPLVQTCRANVQATQALERRLDAVAAALGAVPGRPLVVTWARPLDYEPVAGLAVFLRARGARNPMFLERGRVTAEPSDTLEQRLVRDLEALSVAGGAGYAPRGRLDCGTGCFRVAFSGAQGAAGGADLGGLP
jgi:hypothetical protein